MFKTKKEMIENAISKLKNINLLKKIELHVFLKGWKEFTVPSNLQVNQKSPTKKEVIRRMCRRELFNRNSNRDLSIENIDYIELKEIKEEKKYKQYKKHDYVTNAELNRMYK